MILRPQEFTRTDTLFSTRRSSVLFVALHSRRVVRPAADRAAATTAPAAVLDGIARRASRVGVPPGRHFSVRHRRTVPRYRGPCRARVRYSRLQSQRMAWDHNPVAYERNRPARRCDALSGAAHGHLGGERGTASLAPPSP